MLVFPTLHSRSASRAGGVDNEVGKPSATPTAGYRLAGTAALRKDPSCFGLLAREPPFRAGEAWERSAPPTAGKNRGQNLPARRNESLASRRASLRSRPSPAGGASASLDHAHLPATRTPPPGRKCQVLGRGAYGEGF